MMTTTPGAPIALTDMTMGELQARLETLHAGRERADLRGRIVEIRAYDLQIAEATRALAIINRRATEVEDQRIAVDRALTADEVRAVVRTQAMTEVCDLIGRMMGPTYWYDNPSAHGTFERVADVIANRVAGKLAGRVVDSAQREADLREAVLYGCRFVADRITVDDGRGGPIVNTPSLDDCEDLATGYAHRRAGG